MTADPGQNSVDESIWFLSEACWTVETVAGAARLGILDELDAGRVTAEGLAATHGMTTHQGRLLLASLIRLGLARVDEDSGFCSTVPGLTNLARRLLPDGQLADVLAGQPPRPAADTTEGSARLYPEIVRFLAHGSRAAASVAADHLTRPGLRVLDLGAGAVPWSLAIAERDDTIRVTANDLSEVIPATRTAVREAGLGDRFSYQEGDFFTIDLGEERYDLVIAAGVCHLFDEDANRSLLGKVNHSLTPGGTLAIVEPLPNERLDGPRSVVLYALNLTTRTAGGSVYPYSTYVTWLQGTGFGRMTRADLSDNPPISLITARKPESENRR